MIQIHTCEPPGDVLLFLTGEEEIEDACRKVSKECQQMGEKVGSFIKGASRHAGRPHRERLATMNAIRGYLATAKMLAAL